MDGSMVRDRIPDPTNEQSLVDLGTSWICSREKMKFAESHFLEINTCIFFIEFGVQRCKDYYFLNIVSLLM